LLEIQPELLRSGPDKTLAVKFLLVTLAAQSESLAGRLEAAAEHICVRSATALSHAESRVIFFAATRLPDKAHDVFSALWKMRLEPFVEQAFYLVRQSQKNVMCMPRAGGRDDFENALDFGIVYSRDYRRDQHAGRNSVAAQRFDRVQSGVG
jgi:hypothetical protein